jgi:hypothetical protein
VARLGDRLRRLEARDEGPPPRSEAERFAYWQARQRIRANELTPPDVKHVRSMIALFRIQGSLAGESAERLLERIVSYPHDPGTPAGEAEAAGRSLALIEAELWRAVRAGEPDLAHLAAEVPPEWAAALEASETLADRFLSMPPEVVAKWWVESRAMQERGEPKEAVEEHARRYEESYGIREELLTTALGLDCAVLTDEERHWMIRAPLEDALSGSWGWEIAQAIRRIEESEQSKQARGGKE